MWSLRKFIRVLKVELVSIQVGLSKKPLLESLAEENKVDNFSNKISI
jgi:hypothetical protein